MQDPNPYPFSLTLPTTWIKALCRTQISTYFPNPLPPFGTLLYVMTVGAVLPVNSSSFESANAASARGLSAEALGSPCLLTSGSYL